MQVDSDFDTLCTIVEEAMRESDESNFRITYVQENIQSRVKSKDVKEAFDLVLQVNPEKRYQVFKQAVESQLEHEWECNALKYLFN